MPKTKFQEVIFTMLMVFVMVYVMICYNLAFNMGGLRNAVFLAAFHELVIMAPIAFILDFFIVGILVKRLALRIVDPRRDPIFHLILVISALSVAFMCPLMSLAATVLFKDVGSELVAVWLQTVAINFPMAFFWQIFYAGPLVRFIFKRIVKNS